MCLIELLIRLQSLAENEISKKSLQPSSLKEVRMNKLIAWILSFLVIGFQIKDKGMDSQSKLYDFTMKTIDGKDRMLADYKGKVLMIVNVASQCGYTPQYKELEAMYEKYRDRGFTILAFPSNNFGSQEPGSDQEIKQFCELNYKVKFELFSKISVKGDDQHPLYKYITTETSVPGTIKWNFQKYLVDRKGNFAAKFSFRTEPNDREIVEKIEALLNGNK